MLNVLNKRLLKKACIKNCLNALKASGSPNMYNKKDLNRQKGRTS